MLTIRQQQLDAFAAAQERQFRAEMLAFLRSEFPERFAILGQETVEAVISRGSHNAAAQRLVQKRDIARYIALMFAIGVDFDQKNPPPWVQRILGRKTTAEERLNRIFRRLSSAR